MLTHNKENGINPVLELRYALRLTREDFASLCRLPTSVIERIEEGIPNHIDPKVFKAFPELIHKVSDYHSYRCSRRRSNFPEGVPVVPQTGPEFVDFLRERNLGIDEFSRLALLPEMDVGYAVRHYRLPTQLRRFFEEINSD